MTTVNTSAMYSPSQIGFKGKEKRVIPTIVKNLLEENKGQQVISEELQVDLHRPISEMVSDLTKKANRIDISV